MKKQLLFGVAAMIAIGAQAQTSRVIANPKAVKVKHRAIPSSYEAQPQGYAVSGTAIKKVTAPPYKRIGGSSNVLGVQFSESRALQYNEAINTVGMVLRKQTGWTGVTNGNSGTICYSYSTNNGLSWDSTVVAASGTKFHRYPGGTMYNPSGNTNPANAYAMVSGPWHPGANWQGSYFGQKQLSFPGNNSNGVVTYVDDLALAPGQAKQDFTRNDYQVTSDGVAHVAGDITNDPNGTTNAAYGWRGIRLNYGTHAGGGVFNWTHDSLRPNFKVDGAGDTQGSTSYNMAWSEDGQTGYVVFFGVDINAAPGTSANSFLPYVYKTTDAGATWNRHAPLFDF